MALSLNATNRLACAASKAACRPRRVASVVVRAEKADGYVQNDNSGRGNIFPTTSKPYVSSPTSDAVANTGLGGLQGAAVLVAALAVVGVATVGVIGQQTGETLQTVVTAYDGDSLSAIAGRIAASL